MTRVLLIEDEESFAEALGFMLRREGYEVTVVGDGSTGLHHFQEQGTDIILLDLMLPGLPGTDVCREIRRTSRVPIIMLTAKDGEVDRVVGLELGADDYITKPYSARELLARMKAVLRRSGLTPQQEGILRAGPVELDQDRHMARVRGEVVHLTPKEFALLALLIGQTGRVLSRTSLMRQLWDEEADTKTLDVHIKRLRAKIEIDPANPQFIVTIRGLGYRFISDRIAAATG
ncbi:MAG: response regulator [Actinomycetales bacterium]